MKRIPLSDAAKTALQLAYPSIIESFFVALAGLVDSYMVSGLGPEAVAAVGLTTQPKFLALSVFIALNVSISALVARRFGEKRKKDANEILVTALVAVIVLSLIFSVLFVVFGSPILKLCGSNEDTHGMALSYYTIIIGGMFFNCLQMAINAALRGIGDTKITMRTNLTANTVNIIFNYLLIGGQFGFPRLGVVGAAIATVLGTVVSSMMSLASLMKNERFLSLPYIFREKIRPTLASVKNLIRIGYSVFLEQILLRAGFMATAVMAADQGTGPMAAHQVCMNILSLSFAFGDGLQAAAVALIGRSLGEGKPLLAKEYGQVCQKIGGICSVVLAVAFFFGAKPLMTVFFPADPDIVSVGTGLMYMIIFIVLFQIRQVIYMGCLRGAGDTLYTAVAATVCVTVIRTAISYLACYTLGYGIIGVWMGVMGDQVARFLFSTLRFRDGKWMKIRI